MANLLRIIALGDMLSAQFSDGSTVLAYPTSVATWVAGKGGSGPGPSGPFVWPFSLADANINNGYPEDGFETPGRPNHQGMDFAFGAAHDGANMPAAGAGTIFISGDYFGYGNAVVIDHGTHNGRNWKTLYGHMQDGSLTKNVGDPVAMGETIGLLGNTGNSFGAHLHFETWEDDFKVDPLLMMAELNPNNNYWGQP